MFSIRIINLLKFFFQLWFLMLMSVIVINNSDANSLLLVLADTTIFNNNNNNYQTSLISSPSSSNQQTSKELINSKVLIVLKKHHMNSTTMLVDLKPLVANLTNESLAKCYEAGIVGKDTELNIFTGTIQESVEYYFVSILLILSINKLLFYFQTSISPSFLA